jgi:Subtilase family
MPQMTRNWYFQPWPVGDGGSGDDGSAPGLTCVPFALLQRHGARVLDPSAAAAITPGTGAPAGWGRPPRSTVYRARTLLIPADLLRRRDTVEAINAALAPVGMAIAFAAQERPLAVLPDLPRVVVLVPTGPLPVTVDAWTALQSLRAAASPPVNPVGPPVNPPPIPAVGPSVEAGDGGSGDISAAAGSAPLSVEAVRRISLEHLLAGSAITGSPSSEGNGISGSPSSEGNGLTGPGATDSYGYSGGDTRAPVTLCLPAPARAERKKGDPRRPVVAVLDTGVRAHPWLDVRPDPTDRYATDPVDGFVQVDPAIQAAIETGSTAAAAFGDQPRLPIKGEWDTPVSADPLIGELDDATGHGTFIAGIVRQAAPDAQVLSIRIMHSDDVVYEGDLLSALALVADRVAAAEAGDMTGMVDVVSLSLGYFDESAADVGYSSALWQVIEKLLELGVAVVAAAGNYSTSRPFFPAAFSLQPSPLPVIATGALNPNGSRALFSDGGRWVWAWAAGAAVVSTFPDDINGSRTPEVRVRPHPDNGTPPDAGLPAEREALDPDNYHGHFAVWSGTSFSAPLIAALLAAELRKNAANPALGLGVAGTPAAASRITAALTALGATAGTAPGAAPGAAPATDERG